MENHRFVKIACIAIAFQLMLIGCQESSQKEDGVHMDPTLGGIHRIKVNELDPGSAIYMDSILDTVQYIPLETTQESIIGRINEIVITDDHIVILDIYQTESISSNKYFVSITSIDELMEIKYTLANLKRIETVKSSKFTPPQELLDRIDKNSNPVLAFYTLRPEKINAESVYLTEE